VKVSVHNWVAWLCLSFLTGMIFSIILSGCATVSEAAGEAKQAVEEADPMVQAAAEDLQMIEAMLGPSRVAAADLCKHFPKTCGPLADALQVTEGAVDTAKLAIHEYEAGRLDVETLAQALNQARSFVKQYMKVIVDMHQHTVSRGPKMRSVLS